MISVCEIADINTSVTGVDNYITGTQQVADQKHL